MTAPCWRMQRGVFLPDWKDKPRVLTNMTGRGARKTNFLFLTCGRLLCKDEKSIHRHDKLLPMECLYAGRQSFGKMPYDARLSWNPVPVCLCGLLGKI
jgi:hypothetical protein